MKTLIALSTALTLTLAPMAMAEDLKVASVNVQAEFADVNSTNALDFWPEIETDLQKAIEAEVQPMLDAEGVEVKVKISDISLDGATMLSDSGEFNNLRGWVYLYGDDKAAPADSFEVNLHAQAGTVTNLPENAILVPLTDDDFYTAMVAVFAQSTREKLETLSAPESVQK